MTSQEKALRPHWNQIEGLRALAATSVFVLHAWVLLGMAFASAELILPSGQSEKLLGLGLSKFLLATVGHLGATGVSLFYAISGFLLYQPFLRARLRGEHLALGPYLVRRAARIIPAYWLALVVIGLAGGSEDLFTWNGVVNYFFFGEIYTTLNLDHLIHAQARTGDPLRLADENAYFVLSGNPVQVAWTLCVEVSFYLFLPVWSWLMAKAVGRRSNPIRSEVAVLVAVAVASLAWQIWVLTRVPNVEFEPWLMILPSSIDIFAVGMILACLSTVVKERGWPKLLRSAGSRASAWWLTAGIGYLILTSLESRYNTDPAKSLFSLTYTDFLHFERMVWAFAYLGLVILILTPAVVGDGAKSRVSRFLTWRYTVWVGLVSYGLYLWHVWILEKLSDLLATISAATAEESIVRVPVIELVPVGVPIGFAASLAVAALSWYGLESRVLAWAHRLPLARSRSAKPSAD